MADGVGTTHDVRIGSHHYLVKHGTYRKRGAPQFGPRFTTGDPDYNNLSAWQHWVQKCWVGGMGAAEWKDDAMYDEGVGIDSRHHELMVLSRDLGPQYDAANAADFSVGDETNPDNIKFFFMWKDNLYVVKSPRAAGSSTVYWYNPSVDAWQLRATFTDRIRCVVEFGGSLVFGEDNEINTGSDIPAWSWTSSPGAETMFWLAKPPGSPATRIGPMAMAVYKDKVYFDYGTSIWRMKQGGDWDGSTAFYTDPGINHIVAMEVHQGFLYMASQNGHILRTDGNNTFDMWQFEPGITIGSMRSFDGRLFIMTSEHLHGENNDPWEGGMSSEMVLYQFSGAAVTELKRWGRVGRIMYPPVKMLVLNGKLYFGATDLLGTDDGSLTTTGGFGIAMYDPVEDAFHMVSTNRDDVNYPEGTDNIKWAVWDVAYHRGRLYAATGGHGVKYSAFSYRDMERLLAQYDSTPGHAALGAGNGGWYTSSDFDAGTPGLEKIWNAFVISIDLPDPSCSALVEYSLDGGLTWDTAGSITTLAAARLDHEIILGDGVTEVRGSRFKYRITLRTTNSGFSPILRGVAVRYMPVPEPNWQWDMTLVLSDKQKLHDGTIQEPDNQVKIAELRNAFRTQSLIHFQDHDTTEYAAGGAPGVIIQAMEEMPGGLSALSVGDREYEVRIQLLEMVEQYEV